MSFRWLVVWRWGMRRADVSRLFGPWCMIEYGRGFFRVDIALFHTAFLVVHTLRGGERE